MSNYEAPSKPLGLVGVVHEKENGEIPVQDFLLSVDKKMRAKAFKEIDLQQNS